MTRLSSFAVSLALLTAAAAPAFAADAVPAYVTQAVNDAGRPPGDKERDSARHPAELVAFSGIKPGSKVVDFVPGGGYYTRILAKLVGPKGKVYAVAPMRAGYRDLEALIAENRKAVRDGKTPRGNPVDPVLAIQNIAEYPNVTAMLEMLWQYDGQMSVPEQVDAVWTTENYHDLHNPGMGVNAMMPSVNKAIFAALKPGGVYLVTDHSAAKGTGFTQTQSLHRADMEAVKAEVLAAGFVLDGESTLLSNASDDRAKSSIDPVMHDKTEIFALRFKKPANAPATDMRPAKNAMNGYFGNTSHSGIGTPNQRWVFYHADGTYQEFGDPKVDDPDRDDAVQSGLWYWDALGHNCMIHEYPAAQRGFTVCHATGINKKPGETWTQDNGNGMPRTYRIDPGYHYPPNTGAPG